MHPVLIEIGPLTIFSYGVMLAIAFLVSISLAARMLRTFPRGVVPVTPTQLIDMGCWAVVGGIVGGRLLYALLNWDVYQPKPWQIVAIWQGGLVWYGGFLGGLVGALIYARRHGLRLLDVLDYASPFVALGHAIGRIGCLLNGCCFGVPTTAWCGIRLSGHPTPLVPTQAFESLGLIVLYVALRRLQSPERLKQPGKLTGAYLLGYGGLRFVLEFWRGDQWRLADSVTLPQLMSALACLVGLILLVVQWSGNAPGVSLHRRTQRSRTAP